MDSRWHNLNSRIKNHKHRLYSLTGAVLLFIVLFLLTQLVEGQSLCPIYHFFHIKCIGCGMTRAFISLFCFDFFKAVEYNILSIPLFLGIILYCVLLAVDILLGRELVSAFEGILCRKYMYPVYLVLFLMSVIINCL